MLFNLRENKKGMKRNIEYMGKIENKLWDYRQNSQLKDKDCLGEGDNYVNIEYNS